MMVVAGVFGVVKLFGAGVPSSEEFQTRCWTTLGPVIYAPGSSSTRRGAPPGALPRAHPRRAVLARPDRLHRRATSPRRARGARGRGRARRVRGVVDPHRHDPRGPRRRRHHRHGYALDDGHADLTRDLLEQAVTSVRAGVLSTDVGSRSRAGCAPRAQTTWSGRSSCDRRRPLRPDAGPRGSCGPRSSSRSTTTCAARPEPRCSRLAQHAAPGDLGACIDPPSDDDAGLAREIKARGPVIYGRGVDRHESARARRAQITWRRALLRRTAVPRRSS